METLNVLSVYDVPLLLHRVVHEMDRTADRVLRRELDLSYRRAIVLLVADREGPMNQRMLAALLGHTEPAISTMLRELSARGLVALEAVDGRERRVSITEEGRRVVTASRGLMTPMFEQVVDRAGVDADALGEQLQKLATGMGVA